MNNGFAYVTFISDGEASHFGGDVQAQYVVDKDYFKGKYILLFDDVITIFESVNLMDVINVAKFVSSITSKLSYVSSTPLKSKNITFISSSLFGHIL